MIKFNVSAAPFAEQPFLCAASADASEFDLVLDEQHDLQQYCQALLSKILMLNKSKIKPFIKHQCSLLEDPFTWLNKLEKLIDLNREQVTTKDHHIKIEKALVVIELFREEVEAGKIKSGKFDFGKVKTKLKHYESTEEKLSYLLEMKTEYLQNKPVLIDPNEVPFDQKCELEINLLKSQSKLRKKKAGSSAPLRTRAEKKPSFQINSNLNQFVDIFFQLMHEKKIDGKPYLQATPNELAELISSSFKDKDGNAINLETVKTILKPSRFEKRPKGGGRVGVN
ncbi:MAG: hypothetical protein K0S12_2259 [Bacteroidetes bacterium]|jgi:hypothetical protein|nr:hypothetical protein [Bacteroidota bacterium]